MHGITLIALVVTIIVLLILAGITISLVFSENGIIAKAKEAAEKTNQATTNEQGEINKLSEYMSNMLNGIGGSETEEPELPTIPVNWDLKKVTPVFSEDNKYVPVPKGYTASSIATENIVEDGFVIYEGEEVVNEENKETAQTTRNQFVWVPVENPSEMYGTDSSGKKWGKLYEFSEDEITANNWTEQDGVISITDTSGDYSYREPDVVNNDVSNGLIISQLENEFNSMVESVERYGGFYIGRYETGNLSQAEAAVIKNNTDIGNQTWYTIYNKSKGIAANSNVTTTMIWGSQWDATLMWMYNSRDEEKKIYTYDSTGKGNYSGTQGSENKIIATGSNESYAVNNIYDMAGNVYDKTIEVLSTGVRVIRGGSGSSDASVNPASSRSNNYPTTSYSLGGSRAALYM